MILFIIFAVIPFLEVFVFIKVGQHIGVGWTLALTIITAIIGATLLRRQGLSTWMNAQKNLQDDKFPLEDLFNGLCLLAAGLMLLTPGFVTDTIGFLLFTPPFRHLIFISLKDYFTGDFMSKGYSSASFFSYQQEHKSSQPPKDVIEGDYHEIDTDKDADK